MSNEVQVKFSLDKLCTEFEVKSKIKALKEKGVKSLTFRPSSTNPSRTTFISAPEGTGIPVDYDAVMEVIYPTWKEDHDIK